MGRIATLVRETLACREAIKSMEAISRQLDRARQGESEALSMLYRQFLPGVFSYIAARVPDRTTAEDLTSEVFLKVVEGVGRLRAEDEPGLLPGFFRSRVLVLLDIIESARDSQRWFLLLTSHTRKKIQKVGNFSQIIPTMTQCCRQRSAMNGMPWLVQSIC